VNLYFIDIYVNSEYIHKFGTVFQGTEVKNITHRHFANLQKTIRECLNHDQKWTEGGLYDLCATLVYESITNTLYGSSADAWSIVNELKILVKNVHLLAYPSLFQWFKPNLIRSRDKIAERLSSTINDDSENMFANEIDELATILSK
jgi:hypothetical protein